jgi:hypothetical protein
MNLIYIAMVCHEANRAYCAALGDHTQKDWHSAPQWQRDSAIDGVSHAIKHPEATPEDSHNNWLAGKIADGWTYGKVKDQELKTHPCLVPYGQLPEDQRRKDKLFLAVVGALK